MSQHDRAAVAELARELRAWVEWAQDTGAEGLATSVSPKTTLALCDEPTLTRQTSRARTAVPTVAPPPKPAPAPAPVPAPALPLRSAPALPLPSAPAPAALSPEEKRRRLQALADEVAQCTKCPLHQGRTQTVFARGSPDSELVFVGEGPGEKEDEQGLPFVGAAGQLLDKMVVAMGFARDNVYICNIVKSRPPGNRKPTEDEVAACVPYLREQLTLIEPKVLVALGATGVQGLIGTSDGITRMRGTWRLYRGRIPLMPTFHPAYLLRSPEKKREVWDDLKEVMRKLGRELRAHAHVTPRWRSQRVSSAVDGRRRPARACGR